MIFLSHRQFHCTSPLVLCKLVLSWLDVKITKLSEVAKNKSFDSIFMNFCGFYVDVQRITQTVQFVRGLKIVEKIKIVIVCPMFHNQAALFI